MKFCQNCAKPLAYGASTCQNCYLSVKEEEITPVSSHSVGEGYCVQCGKSVKKSETFCTNCGTKQSGGRSNNLTAPGKGILKVVGILGLVFGGINSIILLHGLLTIDMFRFVMPDFPWEVYHLFSFVMLSYGIYLSVMAILHCGTLEKANFLKSLGIIGIVFIFISSVFDFVALGASAAVIIPINFVLPILYIAGASKNVKAFEER